MFNLPYFSANMRVEERDGCTEYESRRSSSSTPPANFVARYRPTGEARPPVKGTLEYFLTERYCLITVDRSFHACRVDIHHPPWSLQLAEAEIAANTMADAAGIRLPAIAPLLHFSKCQDMVGWMLHRV